MEKKKILIVDDEKDFVEAVAEHLKAFDTTPDLLTAIRKHLK